MHSRRVLVVLGLRANAVRVTKVESFIFCREDFRRLVSRCVKFMSREGDEPHRNEARTTSTSTDAAAAGGGGGGGGGARCIAFRARYRYLEPEFPSWKLCDKISEDRDECSVH
jgi:hypothetical protein